MSSVRASWLLALAVAGVAGLAGPSRAQAGPKEEPLFPPLSNAEAWKHLPHEDPLLPAWARILAGSLPRTTAAMLELDYVHREKNPLGPVLAGKLRWVAADANGCDYAKRYAEADLRRAGLADADVKALAGKNAGGSEAERAALAFARKLTRMAADVTDDEVAELVKFYGPEKVVAIVHTLAHANFQQRIFLALGVEVEPNGPLPPLHVRIAPKPKGEDKDAFAAPPRPDWEEVLGRKAAVAGTRPDWLERNFAEVQKAVDAQKGRKPRIAMPDDERMAKLPPEVRGRSSRIAWSRVSLGYQPELTRAWFNCMSAFQEESNLDQVFANLYFWVVTRSSDCFY